MPEGTEKEERGRRRLTPSARRALIEQAATQVFAERGYGAATMQEIAGTAGVVASVLYDHYPSKRELYIALLEQHGKVLIEGTTGAPSGPDLRAELHQRIEDFFRAIEKNPFVWRMLFRDPPDDPGIATAHAKVHAEAARAIVGALAVGGPPRQAHSPEAIQMVLIAEMIKSSLNGLAVWWGQHREVSRDIVIETATTLLWNGLSGTAPKQP
ncbi:MAG TPA: TetR/AcrR family transcriptional regulator [Solirubrobacterales bacterium]|nr:TetR/AcrR family transcriptional regulator [Solirubrobacterales bacterium]